MGRLEKQSSNFAGWLLTMMHIFCLLGEASQFSCWRMFYCSRCCCQTSQDGACKTMCTAPRQADGKGLVLPRSVPSLSVSWTALQVLWRLSCLSLLHVSIQCVCLTARWVRIESGMLVVRMPGIFAHLCHLQHLACFSPSEESQHSLRFRGDSLLSL